MTTNGVRFLFESESCHYQALRTLGHSNYQGAAPGEVMVIISKIEDQNEESWYKNWYEFGEKCESFADEACDEVSKGNALLRASNYYRSSDFFLMLSDPRRLKVYKKSRATFQEALKCLNLNHKVYQIPYENGKMTTYFFPGDADKPLIIVNGGYDSTVEESYFWIGAALIARGFTVAMFEGPGQSGMIREYGVKFTPDWHKPIGILLDYLESKEPGIKEMKKVLWGISLGAILGVRAAAYEKRIDGMLQMGVGVDLGDVWLGKLPSDVRALYDAGEKDKFNAIVCGIMEKNITFRWAINNGIYTMGGENPYDYIHIAKRFTCDDIHDKVTCPVLNLYPERDLYVNEAVYAHISTLFHNAKSYKIRRFSDEDGSAEHCHIGAQEQAAMVFCQWLRENDLLENK